MGSFADEDGNGSPPRENFDSVGRGFLTVFQLMLQDAWDITLYNCLKALSPDGWGAILVGAAWVCFIYIFGQCMVKSFCFFHCFSLYIVSICLTSFLLL